mmetsp:Transcript_1917/g.2859  ORF Transcript_1917/g.2859 Transcript_1917/m.2859 type:complete len:246 (-) Transcript_1917:784-1521(-)|eukprot:CAMPEP_0204833058 /NCGR_PEP_ID=MMETSP1346-20131115/15626_1 /ASSEMBLY_ACC=CAM_ASM_000771 /TAXON_ID=215587 /ORGANISM="Aplanochytrium stocchinoi, Strain GSBS06" /LENGTH=245 /DNA_ID=CAMNT_0051965315 /DNA_START=119 /DNA_END=856 /DNA_ORIENTATION=+
MVARPSLTKEKQHGGGGGAYNFWFLVVLLVSGSFVMTLVQLSRGLHEELLTSKQSLYALREQLIELGEEKTVLVEQKRDDALKAARLRDKSKTVLEELLNQQKMVKALQFELIAAHEDLNSMIMNCTGSSRKMRKQFNITMRALKDKVTSNREYRILLKKLLEEKSRIENSLESMHYTVYNLTQTLIGAKTKLASSGETITKQGDDIIRMSQEVEKANKAIKDTAALLASAEKKLRLYEEKYGTL